MTITVKTQSGSTYILDKSAMSWKRALAGEGSNQVRTQSGPLTSWPTITVGRGMMLIGPPLDTSKHLRCIYTSDVISVEES